MIKQYPSRIFSIIRVLVIIMKQAWILATCLLAALATVQANKESKRDPSTLLVLDKICIEINLLFPFRI